MKADGPAVNAERYDYEDMPVSRVDPGPDADFETLVWTPAPRPASPTTASRAVLEGWPIDRARFDALRGSYGAR